MQYLTGGEERYIEKLFISSTVGVFVLESLVKLKVF